MDVDRPVLDSADDLQNRVVEIAKYKSSLKKRGLQYRLINREVEKKLSNSPEKLKESSSSFADTPIVLDKSTASSSTTSNLHVSIGPSFTFPTFS